MKPEDNIEETIQKKLSFTAGAELRERMLKDVLNAHEKTWKTKSAGILPNLWNIIMKSPIIKITVTAVLLLGLFILGRHLMGSETVTDKNKIQTATTNQQEDQNDTNRLEILLDSEMETAKKLFENKDLPGMVQLLQECQDPTKLKIAEYLGQIGDGSVLSALQIFAEKWQGSELENPFQEAIDAIEARLETEAEPAPQKTTTSSQEPNKPQAVTLEEETGIEGVVIDKNTSEPIPGALVGFRSNEMVATDTEGKFRLIYTKDFEEAYVTANAPGYATKRIVVRIKKSSMQEVAIELGPGSKLAGTVYDPNGQPVEGAEVGIFGLSLLAGKVITDNEGKFEIDGLNPAGQYYQVFVNHPEYPEISISIDSAPAGQTLQQDIIFKPGVDIFGQVTNAQGMPVASVTVGNTRSGAMWNNKTTETDEEGMYLLENVDVGELFLWTVHDQYAPSVLHTTLEKGLVEQRIDIQLKEPRALHGRVVDSDGNSVPDVTVVIDEYNGITNLGQNRYSGDLDGRFVIPNAPRDGNLTIRVIGKSFSSRNYKVDLSQEECLITVKKSGRIYGKVIDDATGEPITKFNVKLTATRVGSSTYGYSSTWSEEGYTFDSAQGLFDTGRQRFPINAQYQMTVSADGYDPVTSDPVIVQPVTENPDRTEFRLQPAKVYAGRVRTNDGEPIEGAEVVFFSERNAQYHENWPRAVTDKTGIFTISGLSDEPQCVSVSASGFTPRAYLMTNLLESHNQFADIVLDRAAALVGCVLDENGDGIVGASVHAFVDTSQIRDVLTFHPSLGPRVRTDKDGYYHMQNVPVGHVSISVMSPSNYNLFHKTVDLKPGQVMELNFGGEEGRYVINGAVRIDGNILENAEFGIQSTRFEDKNRFSKIRLTDSEGRFKIINVPEGRYLAYVRWRAPENTKWPEGTEFEWYQLLEIQNNIELNINLSDSNIKSAVPNPPDIAIQ